MQKKIFFLTLLIIFVWFSQGISLEKPTHEVINQNIAQRTINGFSLDNYLRKTLGFSSGVAELSWGNSEKSKSLIEQEIWRWIGDGGISEDEPDGLLRTVFNKGRSNNHFHNPLKPDWSKSGLDAYVGPLHYIGQSSILWGKILIKIQIWILVGNGHGKMQEIIFTKD